jgi:hypothetical protein
MRKVLIIAAILTLGIATMVMAHTRGGELFFAVNFPDENIPTVDGILNDWAAVPDVPYLIGSDLFVDFEVGTSTRGEIDVSDMSIRALWGWNDNNNQIYVMAEVFDDVHTIARETPNAWWADDAWEIYIDPLAETNLDQDRDGGNGMTSYNMSVPVAQDNIGQMLPPFEWRDEIEDGIMWGFGWTFEGEMYGESTYFYELWVQPYDFIAKGGDLETVVWSDLEVEQIIHMHMAFDDNDDGPMLRTNQWSTTDQGGCCKADTDMLLSDVDESIDWGATPTAVKSDTWGRIKSQF